jgi:hypothetical protein
MLRYVRADEEEEEQQHVEEKKQHVEEAALERVLRQTWRSHMVAPLAPTREEDRVLIRSVGDQ